MRYKVPRRQKHDLHDFYVQQLKIVRSTLATYRSTRLEVIFGYELYYVEHCFLRAERKGSRYWAEQGLQKAEKVIEAVKAYPKACEEPMQVPKQVRTWMRVGQLFRFTFGRLSKPRVNETMH